MRTVVSTTILHSKIDQFNPNPMGFQLLKGKKEEKKMYFSLSAGGKGELVRGETYHFHRAWALARPAWFFLLSS